MKTFKIANVAKTAVFATVAGALALGLATPADAGLSIQWRATTVLDPDEERQRQEEPRKEDQDRQRHDDVDDPLHDEVHAQDGVVFDAHQRNAIDRVDVQTVRISQHGL